MIHDPTSTAQQLTVLIYPYLSPLLAPITYDHYSPQIKSTYHIKS